MKILYVDTTTSDLIVAVIDENSVRDFSRNNCGVKHSETLCNCVAEAMNECKLSWGDLDAYACAVGPGSFTGIRIGVSTMKGYAVAVEKPFIAINCLQAIAVSEKCGKKMSAVIDAGNGYYFADYLNGVTPCLIAYDDQRVASAGRSSVDMDYTDGAITLVREKYAKGEFSEELSPIYIRRSQAEEKR